MNRVEALRLAPAFGVLLAITPGMSIAYPRCRGVDGRVFVGDARDVTIDQFQLRRVCSDVQGTLYRDYDCRFHLDFASSRVELLDA